MNDHTMPEELRPIAGALDELAELERAAAPAMFEERVFDASRDALVYGEQPVVAKVGPNVFTRLRLAAAIALVGALVSVYLSRVPGPVTQGVQSASLEADVNFLVDLRSSDESLAMLGEKIDTLFLDASSLNDDFSKDWSSTILNDGAL